jgi:CheY-like chemotaxis protein
VTSLWNPKNVIAAVVLATVAYWLVRRWGLKTRPPAIESDNQTVSSSPYAEGAVISAGARPNGVARAPQVNLTNRWDGNCALVVGEHAGMRKLLKLILGGLALEVSEASSDQHGPSTESRLPSLAVVDVDASFEQGMAFWHSLRRNPSTASIPSVFLVEAGNEVMHRQADMAGASICLEKPFHPRDLRMTVERLLSRALDLTQLTTGGPGTPLRSRATA